MGKSKMSRKDDILSAATELFAVQGFNGTATSEIAARAGVAQGTVFHHFKSKENLLVAICDQLVQDYVSGLLAAAEVPGTGWEALERALRFALDFLDERSDSISVAIRETPFLKGETYKRHHPHFQELMGRIILVYEGCLRRGEEDGSILPVKVRESAFFLHMLINGVHYSRVHDVLEAPEMKSDIIEFVRRSLSSEGTPGEKRGAGGGE
ncbi:MAG TPA: TetR/AcrR family transcriptional regulator [Proteobacteria bacterium]|nr:HTH-type transcriptional regulator QacR [bacterium BMS3Abin14]HDL54065.1 TetR/AcrR family transcriptional regulator [Pseudomonadota bacterium]